MMETRLESGLSALLTAGLAFICALLFTRRSRSRLTSRTLNIPRPPPVDPSTCPDTGNFRDNWLSRRTKYGTVHSVIEPHGATTIYIGDALTLKDIIDNPSTFDMGPLHTGSAPMWHMSHDAGQWFAQIGGNTTVKHSSHLFSGSRLASLQSRFVYRLSEQLDRIQPGKKKEDLPWLVREMFFEATMQALFTKSWPRGEYEEFCLWDAELTPFCIGYPSQKAIEVRDRMFRLVLEQCDENLSECSLQTREQLIELESKYGISHEDAVAIVLRTAWLGATQSPLSGAWLICILARQPHNIQKIRNELAALKRKGAVGEGMTTEDIAANPDMMKGENLPTLDNLVNELLRVYSAQAVPRFCYRDTVVRQIGPNNTIKELQLKEGDILQLLFWNVHDSKFNPAWWPEEEGKGQRFEGTLEKFDETRFESERKLAGVAKVGEKGETVKTWTPFGFGARVCPGRYWATAEIKALVIMFLDRFDVADAGEMPKPDPVRWLGVLHSEEPMLATLTART